MVTHALQLFPIAAPTADTDERYTPRWVFDALGLRFDLDPAAPAGGAPWVPAARYYTAAEDGLTQPWAGRVWLNPPFSDAGPWARRWLEHGDGLLLFPISVNASWLHRVLRTVPMLVLLEHVAFDHPTHTGRHVPVAVAITALGAPAVAGLERLAAHPTATPLWTRPGIARRAGEASPSSRPPVQVAGPGRGDAQLVRWR